MKPEALTVASAYRAMATIREFEMTALKLSQDGSIAGSIHLALGQEAIPVGAAAAMQPQDRVLATYRGHGWALAAGAPIEGVLGEILQRAGGVNGGRSGSPLLSHPDSGFLGENSIVGAGVPIAAGVALASTLQGTDRVVLTSIGDGAMNQGATNEGMIFAAARNLPVIFVCENNGWSEMTPTASMVRGSDLAERGVALGIRSLVVDGGDPFAVRDAVAAAAEACRNGQGPVLLECKTVRLSGHYNKDVEHYRPISDREAAAAGDPLSRLRLAAMAEGSLTEAEFDALDDEVSAHVAKVAETALAMPLPDPATNFDHLYGTPVALQSAERSEPREIPYWRAVNTALKTELETRDDVLVYGEDVGVAGGIFGVTRGLQKEFGADRVFDTPIAESAILGSAVGAALEGARPVVEIMWADFVFVALDQIINQASNVRYINRSRLTAPLTIRMQQGVTPGSCAQHSQSIEAMLAHIPGIKVGLPATPQDAYDMLRAAIADPDPTIVIEHRALYAGSGPLQTSEGAVQRAEGARVHREGEDLAIVTWGAMVSRALDAADELAADGISATVLDLRWLRPLDDDAIARAVSSTGGRVLIVHEAVLSGGFGAEVAARIGSAHFGELTTPVVRMGTPDVRMPSAPVLQDALIPNPSDIVAAATAMVRQPVGARG